VRNYGGVVKDSVVKGLNYLVTNDTSSGSVKNQKAREIGVTIINEQQFLDMINEINDNKSRAENP
jgi:DNA ligase (NAD+)